MKIGWEEFLLLQWCLNHWDKLLTPQEYQVGLEAHQLSYLEIDNYFY